MINKTREIKNKTNRINRKRRKKNDKMKNNFLCKPQQKKKLEL